MKEIKNKVNTGLNQSPTFKKIDHALREWMKNNGLFFLRISIGVIFCWFGTLKLFPGLSPAEELATETIAIISFGIFSNYQISIGLGIWEMLIGLGLLTGKMMRLTLLLLFLQLPGTFLPVFFFPDLVFEIIPFVPSMEGQYIFKNLVLIGAGLVMGANLDKKPTGGLKEQNPD
jgi:uncharacterized membrane protein YkgB